MVKQVCIQIVAANAADASTSSFAELRLPICGRIHELESIYHFNAAMLHKSPYEIQMNYKCTA